jgi:ACR3 family arsenite efflux pump ArsB
VLRCSSYSSELTPVLSNSIILIFAEQAQRILSNIGSVFRVFVPMILYFVIMWSMTFLLIYQLSIRKGGTEKWGYKMAVVQVSLKEVEVGGVC